MARSSLTYIPCFSVKFFFQQTIPARFGLIWFSSFRGEDLNGIFYQNMPNLHNRYKSAERKISQKNPEYMLDYSLRKEQFNLYSVFFCEIFLSADLYRLCKLGIF
jgi:hypothetical protein